MKRLLIVTMLVLTVFSLSAYSILDMNSGNQVFRGDARLLSMGNAGVYNQGKSVSLTLNPGLAGLLPEGLRIQFNPGTTIKRR